MTRKYLAPIGLLVLLTLVYAIGAFSKSTWYDESITIHTLTTGVDFFFPIGSILVSDLQAIIAETGSPVDVVKRLIGEDVHPPLYFVTLNIWAHVFGTSLEALRMYSVVLTVASVGVFYRWMSVQCPDHARWATAIFALSGILVAVATDARSTALVILLTVCALHLSTRRDEDGEITTSAITEIALGIVAAGLLLTHYFAALVVVPVMLHRGLMLLTKRNLLYMLAPAIGFVLFLPWFPVFIDHMGARPDQGAGFGGLVAWAKALIWRHGELVVAPSLAGYPAIIAKLGQIGVVSIAAVGALVTARSMTKAPAKWTIEAFALFLIVVGLGMLTALYIVTDKMMSPLRYFAMFAPSMIILTVSGIKQMSDLLSPRLGGAISPATLAAVGFSVLIALQVSMLNFGYENNAQVSGNYLRSVQQDLASRPTSDSLVVIDTGSGRGDLLNAAVAFPGDVEAFVLSSERPERAQQLDDFSSAIANRKEVWITYSITRGEMGADKAALYPEFAQILESDGFERRRFDNVERAKFHAAWVRTE